LYVVTGLLVIYLICLRLYLPPSITYFYPPDVTLYVTPFIHSNGSWMLLICLSCLAVSYWERYALVTALAGFIGITITILLPLAFMSSGQIRGNVNFTLREKHDMFARASTDLSLYPLASAYIFLVSIMLLRLFDYRPTTFRLTLLDVILITVAVAVILGTRGMAMKAYGLV